MDGTDTPIRDYAYLNGEPIAMKVCGTGAGWYYFLNDHLGTPQKLIDNSGNVVWEAAYLPFGKARILTAEIENNLRFPGQYFDEETGLHYNWNRYYNPEWGRYITADPIGIGGGINLYGFAANNPFVLYDIDGLTPEDAHSVWLGFVSNPDSLQYGLPMPKSMWDPTPVYSMLFLDAFRNRLLHLDNEGIDVTEFSHAQFGCEYRSELRDQLSIIGAAVDFLSGGGYGGSKAIKSSIKYHYTNFPEASFKKGLRSHTSVTDNGNLGAAEASQILRTPKPDKVIPIRDNGHFIPNKPFIVQRSSRFTGGGNDFTNPNPVPKRDILPAYYIKKP